MLDGNLVFWDLLKSLSLSGNYNIGYSFEFNIIFGRMQDIRRFFNCSWKKEILSINSNEGEASKRPKGSLKYMYAI